MWLKYKYINNAEKRQYCRPPPADSFGEFMFEFMLEAESNTDGANKKSRPPCIMQSPGALLEKLEKVLGMVI
jgi:hypothetical protein